MERNLHKESRQMKEIHGVVIFILDKHNNVFVVEEKEDDEATGKMRGQCGVICRRNNNHEQAWPVTMSYALEFEAGIPSGKTDRFIDFPPESECKIWQTQFVDNVQATVIVLRVRDSRKLMKMLKKQPTDAFSVRHLGFFSRKKFEKMDLRPGVRHIMDELGDEIFSHK